MALFFYKEKNKDIRAAAYLRLSIEDGDKAESNSIGNQRELIRDFAAERPGLHFYCRYCRAHKENGKNLKVSAATIYKNVMDALELEHLEEEKLAAAIQQGAGKKAIEVVRAERSVQMKSVLAELNMEQFRRVPLYESYMANEITEEQYHAELMDYEEAHRKLNEQLTAIMEDTLVWERALSLRNPWIQQMAQYKTPEELDRNFVKKYIEQVTVTLLDDGQAEISLTMKTDEWKQMLSRIEVEGTDSGTKE